MQLPVAGIMLHLCVCSLGSCSDARFPNKSMGPKAKHPPCHSLSLHTHGPLGGWPPSPQRSTCHLRLFALPFSPHSPHPTIKSCHFSPCTECTGQFSKIGQQLYFQIHMLFWNLVTPHQEVETIFSPLKLVTAS